MYVCNDLFWMILKIETSSYIHKICKWFTAFKDFENEDMLKTTAVLLIIYRVLLYFDKSLQFDAWQH